MNLPNKSVVVTGGSRGLGLGLVEALVDHGAKVTWWPVNPMRSPPWGADSVLQRLRRTSEMRLPLAASSLTFAPTFSP